MKHFHKTWTIALLAGCCLLSGCDSPESRKASHLKKAHDLFEQGELVKARLEFSNVLQLDPAHAESIFMLGKIAEEKQEWRKAYAAYRKTVELMPQNIEARVRLGRLLLAAGDLDGALKQTRAVLAVDPQEPSALALRGTVRLRQKDLEQALADAQRALELQPTHLEALALLAQVRVQQGDLEAARQVLQEALQTYPDEQRFVLGLAGVNETLGDSSATQASLQRLIELEPLQLAHRIRLARYLAASGDNSGAKRVLRDAIQALPEDAEAKLALVQFILATQGRQSASETLEKFISLRPEQHRLRFALAELHASGRNTELAANVYQQIIDQAADAPDGLRARVKLAALALAQGNSQEARQQTETVLAKDKNNPDALMVRAALSFQDGNTDQVVNDLRNVLRSEPRSLAALRLLAEAHIARKEPALADDTLRKIIDIAPDQSLGYLRLARLRQLAGDLDGAAVTVEKFLARQPGNVEAEGLLARIQQAQPDTQALQNTASRITQARPEHPLGHYLNGLVAQRRGDPETSIQRFETALQKEPRAGEVLVGLTRSLLALRRFDEAETRLREALEQQADPVVVSNLLGEVYLAANKPEKARIEYTKAIELRPGSPLAYQKLAGLQASAGDKDSAIATLRQGIEATKGSTLLTSALPLVLQQAGRYEEAIEAYEAKLASDADDLAAANNLAMLLANHRADDPQSIARARTLSNPFNDTSQAPLLDTFGWVQYRSGNFAQAATALQRAARLGESTPEHQYHLGMAYMKLGRTDEAKPLLNAAVGAGQPFPGIEEAKAALDRL